MRNVRNKSIEHKAEMRVEYMAFVRIGTCSTCSVWGPPPFGRRRACPVHFDTEMMNTSYHRIQELLVQGYIHLYSLRGIIVIWNSNEASLTTVEKFSNELLCVQNRKNKTMREMKETASIESACKEVDVPHHCKFQLHQHIHLWLLRKIAI